jgi:hypothetical protein
MLKAKTKVRGAGIILFLCAITTISYGDEPQEIRVRGQVESQIETTSPFSLFFDPLRNGVRLDKQKIDYDLTKRSSLRLGPFLLEDEGISLHMSRETGEFYELDFGFETTRRLGSVYVISFRWPTDFVDSGVIEILDDSAQSLWRRKVSGQDTSDWKTLLAEQADKELFERNRSELEKRLREEKSAEVLAEIRRKLTLVRPRQLSPLHQRTQFGLAHKGFFEIPITQITTPFRFCLSSDESNGRLALCSKRYTFQRTAGRYVLKAVSKKSTPQVLVNDKPVTLKGTAIFLENDVPIKFAAQLEGGSYFEFVSNPKEIHLVDIARDETSGRINIIGYGDAPMGKIKESFFADSVHWGFLNFTPTIGDLRKFWRGSVTESASYLYLRGEGGAPFRQAFEFENLPTQKARIVLSDKTTKSTYSSTVWVEGKVDPEIKVSASDTETERVSPTEFRWNFPAPERGTYNKGFLEVHEDKNKWLAEYEIYRGYPAELSVRLSGVLDADLNMVLLGELAGQYWFESLLGLENYWLSRQRWGIAAKYFEAFVGTNEDLRGFAVGNVDLKYRFSPGVWARDPTVGAIVSFLNIDYTVSLDVATIGDPVYQDTTYHVPALGGGVFWARSMPKPIDDFFNLVPFMRYPKWVDWEVILYPMTLREGQTSNFMFAMNFHGKVQWKKNFFGEAGFGIKNYSFGDVRSSHGPKQLADAGVIIGYGTVGLGLNF